MWPLCQNCALEIYGRNRPSRAYAERVARFLFVTGAHESAGYHQNRQTVFSAPKHLGKGGHGYWQLEEIAIRGALQRMVDKPDLAHRSMKWLYDWYGADKDILLSMQPQSVMLHTVIGWPKLCVLLARVFILGEPRPIPFLSTEQAEYWSKYYNKRDEEEKMLQWLEWSDICKPVMEG